MKGVRSRCGEGSTNHYFVTKIAGKMYSCFLMLTKAFLKPPMSYLCTLPYKNALLLTGTIEIILSGESFNILPMGWMNSLYLNNNDFLLS